ncbi:uncharacterized protein LOC144530843 [Sander vitreus]
MRSAGRTERTDRDTMAGPQTSEVKQLLARTLQELGADDFRAFKWYLEKIIPTSKLDGADRLQTVDLMVQLQPLQAVDMTIEYLTTINRNDLALELSQNNAGVSQR